MYGGEVTVEVAMNFFGAVILNLDTGGHWRAVWRSRAHLRGQQGSSFGWSDLCSETRRPQGGHRGEGGGVGSGGATAGVCVDV